MHMGPLATRLQYAAIQHDDFSLKSLNGASELARPDFLSVIHAYAGLELIKDGDIFKACGGIMNWFSATQRLCYYWGMPTTSFFCGLLFTSENFRRDGNVPSWSWAAWKNPNGLFNFLVRNPEDCQPVTLYRFAPLPELLREFGKPLFPIHWTHVKLHGRLRATGKIFADWNFIYGEMKVMHPGHFEPDELDRMVVFITRGLQVDLVDPRESLQSTHFQITYQPSR